MMSKAPRNIHVEASVSSGVNTEEYNSDTMWRKCVQSCRKPANSSEAALPLCLPTHKRRSSPGPDKTTLALLYDEGSDNTYDVRLRLTTEALTVQLQDVVCVGGAHPGATHRTVTLCRQPVGGLGLSIKGGAEHRVPVVISKIFKDQAADRSGMLFVGDAVLQVNGIHVEHATHGEVVHLLRNAGAEVTITVAYLREAPSFLKLPLGAEAKGALQGLPGGVLQAAGQGRKPEGTRGEAEALAHGLGQAGGSPRPSSSPSSRASSPLFDSSLHLNGHCSHKALSSPSADDPKYEKRWLDTLSIPLSMARISRYKAGTGSLRSNAFEVLSLDGARSGVLQFPTARDCGEWLSNAFEVLSLDGARSGVLQFPTARDCGEWLCAVSANIGRLMLQSMKMANKCCSPGNQVVHMGWVYERLQGADSPQTFASKFLALKGSSVYILCSPPVSTADWVRAESVHNLCEVRFKAHKLWVMDSGYWLPANLCLGLQDLDLEDQRPYCFSLLAGQGKSHVFTVALGTELAVWEKAFQRATFLEVQRTGSKTYMCSWQGEVLCFTVDFALGFTCFDNRTKNVLWRFKFSQLKGSSDDGNTRVKLLFQNPDTKQIETKELEFQDLPAVLHCVHAFMASKVASLDPAFPDGQGLIRRHPHSSKGSFR
ncbi:Gamma-2-syntrophin [Fukomys damarensis]|uniref:Gamma-2-syntrophin n=1 Tax=Fukomys damarensis TaxID=885580 RepID=A0A091DTV3_FUKDA|nr:Gamma-2-syntrophin [Fukomys damarensis]